MSVTLSGTGGLMTRLGRILAAIRNINGLRGETLAVGDTNDTGAVWGSGGATVKDSKTAFDHIEAQFASAQQDLIDGLYAIRSSHRNDQKGTIDKLKTLAQSVLIRMVHDDATLVKKDKATAMTELVRQMVANSDSVNANAVSISVSAASTNTGTSTVIASVVGPTGANREYILPETLEAKVTADSQPNGGGATVGRETITVTGEVKETDKTAWNWPDGSAASKTLKITDPTEDAGQNLLINSDFDTFTVANTPDNWDILVGTAGTDIFSDNSTVYRSGGKALKFTGTGGSPLSSIAQKFANASLTGGTTTSLKPNTVYAVNFYCKKSGSLAAGALEVGLVDGSNSAVSDDASTANTKTIAHGSITTSFAAYNAFFRTPKVLPTTGLKLRVRISTALTSGESLYIDDLALVEATELYTGGPYLAAFRSSTDAIKNDAWNVAVSNDLGGLLQTGFEQLFDMTDMGLQLPSDAGGSETVADTLVA